MEDTPINDMSLDMMEAELNSTSTIDPPVATAIEPMINQSNVADDTLSTNRFDRPEAIYLLGLDSMNTKDIQNYCRNTALKRVDWIDDSSCVLVFDNDSDAKLAAQELLQASFIQNNDTMLNSAELRNAQPFERPDVTTNNSDDQNDDDATLPPVRRVIDNLQIRMATDSDIKTRGARQRSRYYLIHGEPPIDRSNSNNDSRSNRTTTDGKPLSILDRLGSRVPPLSAHRRQGEGRYRRQYTDYNDDADEDDRNSSSRYDRSSRHDASHRHSRRRSLSPSRDLTERPTVEGSENGTTTAASSKIDDIPPPPTTAADDDENNKSYEIPESIRSRMGKLE